MTPEKIIARLNELKHKSAAYERDDYDEIDSEWEDDIVAIDAAIAAVKHCIDIVPPNIIDDRCLCPCCGKDFGSEEVIRDLQSWHMKFCKYCGKHIDWSEVRR